MQHVFVGRAHAVRDQLVAHIAAIHIAVLPVGARAGGIGQAGAAVHAHRADLQVHLAAGLDEGVTQHVLQALAGTAGAQLLDQLAFVPHAEAHVRP